MQNRQLHIIPDPQHPSIHHAPNSSSSGWGRAGVPAVVKDKMGRVKFKEPTD